MDSETRREFDTVARRMEQYEKDSRTLIRVVGAINNLGESMETLSRKVNKVSGVFYTMATAFLVDLSVRLFVK